MSEHPPDFSDLVGGDLPAAERERLLRVHDLLIQAGPPPELPRAMAEPPTPPVETVTRLPRRRVWVAGIAAAAAVALIGFGAGYLVGDRGGPVVERTIAMRGDGALASLDVFAADEAGNWPMRLRVEGLPAGPTYELWLTRNGQLAESCGVFVVGPGTTAVPLNAPYKLREFDGWIVVEAGETTPLLTT